MSRRLMHAGLATSAIAVWGSVAFRFVALSSDPATPADRVAAPTPATVHAPFVFRADYPDPFYYGTSTRPAPIAPSSEEVSSPREGPPEEGFYPPPRDLPPPPPPFRLTALLGPVAVLQNAEGQSFLVRKGEWIGDAEILAVKRAEVTLRVGATTHTLTLPPP